MTHIGILQASFIVAQTVTSPSFSAPGGSMLVGPPEIPLIRLIRAWSKPWIWTGQHVCVYITDNRDFQPSRRPKRSFMVKQSRRPVMDAREPRLRRMIRQFILVRQKIVRTETGIAMR